ncbi:MAG: pyridoxamine 5'-phosphate oxidase family protein [Candidatus Omnitrophota bacterium]|nr:pyridoxamine 5'-phosphate oxidase family protein [Candidatus Omnitrophota bacterium]
MAEKRASIKGLKKKILKVIKGSKLASLATVVNGKPWVRYVVARSEGLTLYICTFKDSRKVKQIKKNPKVHITIGGSMENMEAPYVQIAACAKARSDAGIRKRFWMPFMRKYYTGVDDPQYVVIEVRPVLIEYMSTETHTPQIYKVGRRK